MSIREGQPKDRPSPESLSPSADAATATNYLLNLSKIPGYLLDGRNWGSLDEVIPGAGDAGIFIETLKQARKLKPGYGAVFTLAKMVWHETIGLIPDLSQDHGGEARAILVALLGGQLYKEAVKFGVPQVLGEFSEESSVKEPYFLSTFFKVSHPLTIPLYGGGPEQYREFRQHILKAGEVFSLVEKQQAVTEIQIQAEQRELGREDHYPIASRVLLEIFINRLQQAKKPENVPLGLPAGDRRIVSG